MAACGVDVGPLGGNVVWVRPAAGGTAVGPLGGNVVWVCPDAGGGTAVGRGVDVGAGALRIDVVRFSWTFVPLCHTEVCSATLSPI